MTQARLLKRPDDLAEALGIVHHFLGGFYAKQATLPAGSFAVQHKHAHDHDSVLLIGEVEVTVDGVTTRYVAPAILRIKAGAHHTVAALRDSLWFCVHRTDVTDPELVDEALIEKGA